MRAYNTRLSVFESPSGGARTASNILPIAKSHLRELQRSQSWTTCRKAALRRIQALHKWLERRRCSGCAAQAWCTLYHSRPSSRTFDSSGQNALVEIRLDFTLLSLPLVSPPEGLEVRLECDEYWHRNADRRSESTRAARALAAMPDSVDTLVFVRMTAHRHTIDKRRTDGPSISQRVGAIYAWLRSLDFTSFVLGYHLAYFSIRSARQISFA